MGNNISRRRFINNLWAIIALPYLLFAGLMIRKHQQVSTVKKIHVQIPQVDGVFFHDEVILVKKGNDFNVFSSRCTHLGCRINKVENGMLVCPCHGSSFSESGTVVIGPASNGLKELLYEIDYETQEMIINV